MVESATHEEFVNMALNIKTPKSKSLPVHKTTVVPKILKGDTWLVISDAEKEPEDEYLGLYFTTEDSSKILLMPPYNPLQLSRLPFVNNTLNQCIEAMEVNIDGTGHEFEPVEIGKEIDPTELKTLENFFDEPYPNKSFVTIRRRLRREMEAMGWGALEVLRNVTNDIVALRNTVSHSIRLVRLDKATTITKTMMRNGEEVDIQMSERERRYVQRIGVDLLYYRDFGSSRQLNKFTGDWEQPDAPIPPELRATELLFFTVNEDPETSYGIPRWINELPSVIGSRKAEEQNLEFFDAGGVPPAIVFVQGGTLVGTTADQLKMLLSGQSKSRNRAAVVEVQSSTGSTDTAGTVSVSVERFGSATANDALYQTYDKNMADKVRNGFRIPPLFLGDVGSFNYATALASYMVAEAQVFQPERSEFDDILNKTLLKAMGIKTAKFKSIPISIKNLDGQLAALGLVKGMVAPKDFVDELNTITGLSVVYDQNAIDAQNAQQTAQQNSQQNQGQQTDGGFELTVPAQANAGTDIQEDGGASLKSAKELMDLAQKYLQINGLMVKKYELSPSEKKKIESDLKKVHKSQQGVLLELIAAHTYGHTSKSLKELVKSHIDCC